MEQKATHDDMDKRDLYWLLDLNEAIDVWQDTNDLDSTAPIPAGYTGTSFVR
jgi:hypothetical protein